MQATLSARTLKAAIKSVKTVLDTYEKGETLYGVVNTDTSLCLQGVSGSVFASYVLGDRAEDLEGFLALDIPTLSSLKFPEDTVKLETSGSVLKLSSAALDVETLLPASDRAFKVKQTKQETSEFVTQHFLDALSFHTYGMHHNPIEAARRLVRLSTKDGRLHLLSFDKQVSAFNSMPFAGHLEEPIFVTPKPIVAVLGSVSDEVFRFGATQRYWVIETSALRVVYPNVIKPVSSNFDKILDDIATLPCRRVAFEREYLLKSLGVLTPSIKAGKEENPKMHFYLRPDDAIQVTVSSEKIRSMTFKLEGRQEGVVEPEAVGLNFRYTKEFAENLNGDVVYFQYWKYDDAQAPLRGRALSFYADNGRYIISRLSL
jgi:hypothetical protein